MQVSAGNRRRARPDYHPPMADDQDHVGAGERRISPVDDELEIVDVPERRRYEVRVGSRVVGHLRYARSGQAITLVHTEVDPDQEGKGLGSRLARGVLANVRERGLEIVVRCPFIAAYVRRHRSDYPEIDLDRQAPRAASAG